MKVKIPDPLKVEHEELHQELANATKAAGKAGEAARAVGSLLHPHFAKEEEYALPPLGLLPALAEGKVTADMRQVLARTDRLKAALPQMLAEHRAIVGALDELLEAAQSADQPEIARFAEKLILHAQTEEEVLDPASILVGEYVRRWLRE